MAKRPQSETVESSQSKRICKQTSIDKFFTHSDNVTDKPIISDIELTPGIHMYDSMDIENSKGLEKEYKRFWNEKATTLV